MIPTADVQESLRQFASDVRQGLCRAGQKELPSSYLYDELGSALFEAITLLPEYGLTRADQRLLERHAPKIAAAFPQSPLVIELGSGSGRKTRHILQALGQVRYCPVDVSSAALEQCQRELAGYAEITPMLSSYLSGVREAIQLRKAGQPVLLLFLGSTIGNFNPTPAAEFLSSLRGMLNAGDALLLGADLVKPIDRTLLAYDDPTGVTAAFNLNLLGRMNRELRADFDLRRFAHEARYNEREQRVEMHLRVEESHRVRIREADFHLDFTAGETIWTESSHKFTLPDVANMAETAGFDLGEQWVDREWPFVEALLHAGPRP